MSDAQLSPLTEWMVKVVAEASQRYWMVRGVDDGSECCHCGSWEWRGPVDHLRGCRFARLEELLRQKPVVQGKAEP